MWLAVGTTCLCAEPAPAVTPFASCHKFADKQNGGFVRSAEAGLGALTLLRDTPAAFGEGFTRIIAVSVSFDRYLLSICGVSAIAVFGGAVSLSFPLCSDSGVMPKHIQIAIRR